MASDTHRRLLAFSALVVLAAFDVAPAQTPATRVLGPAATAPGEAELARGSLARLVRMPERCVGIYLLRNVWVIDGYHTELGDQDVTVFIIRDLERRLTVGAGEAPRIVFASERPHTGKAALKYRTYWGQYPASLHLSVYRLPEQGRYLAWVNYIDWHGPDRAISASTRNPEAYNHDQYGDPPPRVDKPTFEGETDDDGESVADRLFDRLLEPQR